MATISVVICTRNRANFLRETLTSLAEVRIPKKERVELIIVDNGSTDNTQNVVKQSVLGAFHSVRYIEEKRPGLSHARNTAVAAAEGDIVLFTDDDVRVPRDWISGMVEPIRSGRADAVAGGVELAPYLRRPWQVDNPWLTSPLASTRALDPEQPERMVGANMTITREVLEHVPPFDPNLGAGSEIGTGEETLLTHQIKSKGFRLVAAFNTAVEHHCLEERLLRVSYLRAAARIGRSEAYIDYHWRGTSVNPLRLYSGLVRRYALLVWKRISRFSEIRTPEGIFPWEFQLQMRIYYRWQLLSEWGSDKKYITELDSIDC